VYVAVCYITGRRDGRRILFTRINSQTDLIPEYLDKNCGVYLEHFERIVILNDLKNGLETNGQCHQQSTTELLLKPTPIYDAVLLTRISPHSILEDVENWPYV